MCLCECAVFGVRYSLSVCLEKNTYFFLACEFILWTSVQVKMLHFCWERFVVRLCLWREKKKKRLSDQTFHCEGDRIEELEDKTTLHWPWRRGSHDSNRSHHFQERDKKKQKPFNWFTVMPTHCAPSIDKIPSWDVLKLSSNVPRPMKKDWQEDKWGAKNWVKWVEIL